MARPLAVDSTTGFAARSQQDNPKDSLHRLIATIVQRHHGYLKRELPAIEALIAEAARVEISGFQRTAASLLPLFLRFRRELESHMRREEVTLFPLIERLEAAVAAGQPAPRNSFGPLGNAIAFMDEDHEFSHKLLHRMTEMTCNYASPPDASEQYAMAMNRLHGVAIDMDEHVQIEDQVLFPRAMLMESQAA